VKLLEPMAIGVPEITPVLASSVRPFGKVPVFTDQTYGPRPPVACNLALNRIARSPGGRVTGEMVSCSRKFRCNARACVCGCAEESLACTVKESAPAVPVGVPDRTPVVAFSDMPVGRVPALTDHVTGPTPPVVVSV